MATFRNVSPLGALDVPALGRIIEHGEDFDVPEHLAAGFAAQPDNFETVDYTPAVEPETEGEGDAVAA